MSAAGGVPNLIVELHSLRVVGVGFGLKGSAGDGLGPDLAPEDAADGVVVLQRSVQPGEVFWVFTHRREQFTSFSADLSESAAKIPCQVDPFVGVRGDFPPPHGPLGRRLGRDASVQQALLQQEDPGRLLETHQTRGADGRRVQVLQLPVLVAHFLRNPDGRSKEG